MRPRRPEADTVDGVQAELDVHELCTRYRISMKTAAERISMSHSTPWRWKNEGLRPMPWQVNLLIMSVLELAERKGPLDVLDMGKLALFRGTNTKPPAPKVTLSQVKRLRTQLAEAERLLLSQGA